jgi:hypothetical protein
MELQFDDVKSLRDYCQENFPRIYNKRNLNITISRFWKRVYFIHCDSDFEKSIGLMYKVINETTLEINDSYIKSELTNLEDEYLEAKAKITEAKFKYSLLKILVGPFLKSEIPNELVFERGHLKTSVVLTFENNDFAINMSKLLEKTPIEEISIFRIKTDWAVTSYVAVPLGEFIKAPSETIEKLNKMENKINKICLDFYNKEEKLTTTFQTNLDKLRKEKDESLAIAGRWR